MFDFHKSLINITLHMVYKWFQYPL